MKIYHKKTDVNGRTPSSSTMEYGEIAVNYNATNPRLIIKDSDNAMACFLPESKINETFSGINTTLTNLDSAIDGNTAGIETIQSWIDTPITIDEITNIWGGGK